MDDKEKREYYGMAMTELRSEDPKLKLEAEAFFDEKPTVKKRG